MHLVSPAANLWREFECIKSVLTGLSDRWRKFHLAREKVLECEGISPRRRLEIYHTLWWLRDIAYIGRAPNLSRWRAAVEDLGTAKLIKLILAGIERGEFEGIFSPEQVRNIVDFTIFARNFGPLRWYDRFRRPGEIELVVTIGVAGSGKSTYINRHFPDFARVSMDEVRGRFALDPGDPFQSQLAYRYAIPVLERTLAGGRSAVWDATALTSSSRKRVIQIGRKYGAKITAVFFDLPLEEISRRNTSRRRVVPWRAVVDQFRQLEPPHRWEFDKILIAG